MSPWKALVFAKHDAHDALGNTKMKQNNEYGKDEL